MSSEPPPGSGGQPPEDDPFRKQPPSGDSGAGSPYDSQPPPYQGGPYGGDPYGGGGYPADPLAGMPPLADSGRRTLARIIDMVMVAVVVWLLTWAFRVNELDMNADNVDYGKSLGQSLIAALLYIGYDTFMISRTGQTLGKKWLGMRVANLDDGSTPSVQTSLVRALVLWIPFAFCCACIWTAICGGWSYFDKPYKQGLHDKAAKTVVVSTR
ncbi:integral membrane protein [Streptomyces davaonensis JCM 4913]|uniref:Integral membrane protein n=1 Tax=Streptomyces davaonensis (strain DSM 101723 / JCM 4913 / KCC S-0913 / 768) TaxID=1214101 RepID=K4R0D5_STRDJ|nr:RDD family protein [Streptomyces davaonensis]CCK29746.1 integral membrane protein [Streptomyces davaonensis JCM 4913]